MIIWVYESWNGAVPANENRNERGDTGKRIAYPILPIERKLPWHRSNYCEV